MGIRITGAVGLVLAGALAIPGAVGPVWAGGPPPPPDAFSAIGIRVIPGDSRTTTISNSSDVDRFLFDGFEDERLSVDVRGKSGFEPDFVLRDADGNFIGMGNRYQRGGTRASLRSFTLPYAGSYFIDVSGFDGSSGEYELRIAAGGQIRVNRIVSVPAGDSVDVVFDGLNLGAVSFEVDTGSGPAIHKPELLDPDEDAVNDSAANIRHSGSRWRGDRIPLGSGNGTYRLRLTGPNSGTGAVVSVRLQSLHSAGRATRIRIPSDEPFVTTADPFGLKVGQTLTVTGGNFSPRILAFLQANGSDTAVDVASVAADGTSLSLVMPASADGVYGILLVNPEGQAATRSNAVSVVPASGGGGGGGGVGGISPDTGPTSGGTLVIVSGAGFINGITVGIVYQNSTYYQGVTFINSTEVRFTTPGFAAGTVDIVLQNPGENPQTRNNAFTFTDQTVSRFFTNETGNSIPQYPQSGDAFAGNRGFIVDLNGDGANDIVLQASGLNPGGASLRILHNDGSGVFADDTHRSIPDRYGGFASAVDLGEGPGLAIGDLDGDGFPDMVMTSRGYVPNSDGVFGATQGYIVDTTGSGTSFGYSLTAGKMLDFPIDWNDHYSATRIFKNDGNGNFFSSPRGAGSVRRMPIVGFYVEYADAQAADNQSYLATYDPTTFTFTGDSGFENQGAYGGERFEGDAVGLGDLDGDGSLDMVVASNASVRTTQKFTFTRPSPKKPFDAFRNFQRPSTRVLLNTAKNGLFTDSSFPLLDPSSFAFPDTGYDDRTQAQDLAVTDVNGDGKPDIILVSDRRFTFTHNRPGGSVTEYRPGTRIFINQGSGSFDDATRSNMPVVDAGFPTYSQDFFAASRVAMGDLDGDGDPDMVITSPSGAFISGSRPFTRVLINRDGPNNKPTGIFDDKTDTAIPATTGYERWQGDSVALLDIDGANGLDIVITSNDGILPFWQGKAATRVLLNDGNGVFSDAPPGINPDTFIPAMGGGEFWLGNLVVAGDLDGDGVDDLLISVDSPSTANATRILIHK